MSDSTTPHSTIPASVPPAAPPARSSGLSIAALAVGIAAFVSAVIPGLSFVAFIPALVAIGLGIAALVSRAGARGAAVAGLVLGPVSLIVAIIVSVAFAASVVTPQSGPAPVEDSPAAEAPVEEPAAPAAEVGTRENPAPAGTVVEITDASGPVWRVELGAANLNAGDVIAAENQFNEPADAGSQYVLVPVTFTYRPGLGNPVGGREHRVRLGRRNDSHGRVGRGTLSGVRDQRAVHGRVGNGEHRRDGPVGEHRERNVGNLGPIR